MSNAAIDYGRQPPESKQEQLEQFIQEARRLRKVADISEARFLEYLRAGELAGLWRRYNYDTFVNLLEENHICAAKRYQAYCKAVEVFGPQRVERWGVMPSRRAMTATAPVRMKIAQEYNAVVERTGLPLSDQTARGICKSNGHAPPKAAQAGNEEIARLRRENADLRCENEALKAQLAEAQARIAAKRATKRR